VHGFSPTLSTITRQPLVIENCEKPEIILVRVVLPIKKEYVSFGF